MLTQGANKIRHALENTIEPEMSANFLLLTQYKNIMTAPTFNTVVHRKSKLF